jgi:DNA-binding transcriptional LysR family regulator
MRDIDLTTLRFFVAACDTGSLAGAAERCHIVASAISKRIGLLEDQFNTRLLVRGRHGVRPTDTGETLLQHAREMLMNAQRINRDLNAFNAGARGQVRVLATASVMAESLTDDLAAFLDQPKHEGIRVDIEERVSTAVVQGIRDGVASVGICWDAADLRGLQSRAYRHDHLALATPPEHPLANRRGVSFADSLDWEHVGLPVNSAVLITMARTAAEHGRHLNFRMIVTNFGAAMRVVRARLAISVVPAEAAAPFVDAYGLRIIPLTDAWAQRRFTLCYRDERALAPAARDLVEYLSTRE